MNVKKVSKLFLCVLFVSFLFPVYVEAKSGNLHPMNKRLVDLGYMPYPKYFPQIPRIPVNYAKKLWEEGEARFILVSYQKKDLIVGAVHLDNEVPPFDISRFRLTGPDQTIVVY